MKILDKEQIYQADKITIAKQNISSYELMERAGGHVFQWLHHRLKSSAAHLKIFCGIGNNGGDGLVIARLLLEQGYTVSTFIVNYSDHHSDDFLRAEEDLKKIAKKNIIILKSAEEVPQLSPVDFLIDAVFGIGYNRPAPQWVQDLFKKINESEAYVLSIDVPSGLYLDQVPQDNEVVVKPTLVLSFQVPKLVFFFPRPEIHRRLGNN